MKKAVPEIFYTSIRKVEPVGGDCIRVYCSIERNGVWDDRVTLLVPITAALKNWRFAIESAKEIFSESHVAEALDSDLRVH